VRTSENAGKANFAEFFFQRLSEKSRDAPKWGSQTSIKQGKEPLFAAPRPIKGSLVLTSYFSYGFSRQ
jgi:hypothetical protein